MHVYELKESSKSGIRREQKSSIKADPGRGEETETHTVRGINAVSNNNRLEIHSVNSALIPIQLSSAVKHFFNSTRLLDELLEFAGQELVRLVHAENITLREVRDLQDGSGAMHEKASKYRAVSAKQ